MKMRYPKSKLDIKFGLTGRKSWAYSEGIFRGKSGLREEWFNLNYRIFRVREDGVVDESYVVDFIRNIHRFDYSLESLLSCLDNKDSYGLNYKVVIDFHDLNNRINVLPEVTINKLVADKEFSTFIENLKGAIDSLDLFLNGDKGETKSLTYVYKKVSSFKLDFCIDRILC